MMILTARLEGGAMAACACGQPATGEWSKDGQRVRLCDGCFWRLTDQRKDLLGKTGRPQVLREEP